MNLQSLQDALREIAQPYADGRIDVFSVRVAQCSDTAVTLTGRVLEESHRQALVEGLRARFPGIAVDAAGVDVLRKPSPNLLRVATNLTSMHASTSFLAEQVTQMLNGESVEVLWEEKKWAYVRQCVDGYLGWTYRPYLSDPSVEAPNALVITPVAGLHDAPNAQAGLLTRVLGGTFVHAAQMDAGWAKLGLAGGMQGWCRAEDLRALTDLPMESQARQTQLIADALSMIGVPYMWGGCSANGIDCSGFAQLLHRWAGVTIPRDADMQFTAGQQVEPPFAPGDLLFFGEAGEQRRITHVTVSLGGWRVIHSSRSRNGVQVDDVQAVESLRQSYLCAAAFLRDPAA